MIILGLLSQSFFLIGYIVVIFISISEGGDFNSNSDLPIVFSCILFITTYLIGYFVEPNFSFNGWCYIFICTIIGIVHIIMLCMRNDMNKGKSNMVAMLLVFSNLISITTKFNDTHSSCFGVMSFSFMITLVPLFMSISLFKNSLSSFDSRMKINRYRLILYIFLWQSRLVLTWNGPECGGHTSSYESMSFGNIIVDLMTLSLTCDNFWK